MKINIYIDNVRAYIILSNITVDQYYQLYYYQSGDKSY
jgi:hypothetical protein